MDKNRSWIMTAVIAVLVVIAVLLLLAWFNDNDPNTNVDNADNNAAVEETQEAESQLNQILENPDAFIGEAVTVTAEIEDTYSNRVFSVSEDALGDELLVVARSPLTDDQTDQAATFLADNANVEVTGEVALLTVAEIERDFDLDFTADVEAEFENEPIIIASQIRFIDQSNALWDFSDETNESGQ